MTPANAAMLNDYLDPLWAQLRAWTSKAVADREAGRTQLSHEELVIVRRSIALTEEMLRRLVLLAATAVEVDIQPRWSAAPKSEAKRETSTTRKPRNRKKRTIRLFKARRRKTSGPPEAARHAEAHSAKEGPATTTRRPKISTEPPDMTPEQFNAWAAAQPPTTAADRAQAAWEEQPPEPRHNSSPKRRGQPRLEQKAEPETVCAKDEIDYLLQLAQFADDPSPLIRRAAIVMARRREIAYQASLEPLPKPRGLLAACVEMYATVIPLHVVYSEALCYFALSYTEPDTS